MDFVILRGQADNNGKLLISGKAEMLDFLKRNKNRRILIRLEAYDKGSTEAQIGFYFGKIVPDVQRGFLKLGYRITPQETDRRIRAAYYKPVPEDLKDLDKEEMSEFIDFIKQWAAENLYTFIPDPRTI